MNILAIGAHPDDLETSCGGTLAKYAKQGHKIFTATTTNGNVGSATLPMKEIAEIRKEEARRAAAHIGAEYICLDYDDEMFFEDRTRGSAPPGRPAPRLLRSIHPFLSRPV